MFRQTAKVLKTPRGALAPIRTKEAEAFGLQMAVYQACGRNAPESSGRPLFSLGRGNIPGLFWRLCLLAMILGP